jgi:hypothetical protein
MTVSDNTVLNVSGAGFFQHYGQRNVIHSNSFASVNNAALDSAIVIGYDRWTPDLPPSSISFRNNSVQVGSDGKAVYIQGSLEGDDKDYIQVFFDYNIYTAANVSAVSVSTGRVATALKPYWRAKHTFSFSEWQKLRQDQHSTLANILAH